MVQEHVNSAAAVIVEHVEVPAEEPMPLGGIPAGLVVGDDPEIDARRFRRTESGVCLITQPMIDARGTGR